MFRLVEVRTLSAYPVHLRYNDGVEGEVDLSGLVGRGVFSRLQEPGEFEKVAIGPSGGIEWNGQVDLCADSLYLRITGKSAADVFPSLAAERREAELNA
jgi:hypothetical protein